jgi:hypothetical protein
MLKPLIPLVSDATAHALNEAIHISTVHARYGSNHLEVELANETSPSENGKTESSVRSEDPFPLHTSIAECKFDFNLKSCATQYNDLKFYKLPDVYILNQGPPPKFS